MRQNVDNILRNIESDREQSEVFASDEEKEERKKEDVYVSLEGTKKKGQFTGMLSWRSIM